MEDKERIYKRVAYSDALEIIKVSKTRKEAKRHMELRVKNMEEDGNALKELNGEIVHPKAFGELKKEIVLEDKTKAEKSQENYQSL